MQPLKGVGFGTWVRIAVSGASGASRNRRLPVVSTVTDSLMVYVASVGRERAAIIQRSQKVVLSAVKGGPMREEKKMIFIIFCYYLVDDDNRFECFYMYELFHALTFSREYLFEQIYCASLHVVHSLLILLFGEIMGVSRVGRRMNQTEQKNVTGGEMTIVRAREDFHSFRTVFCILAYM